VDTVIGLGNAGCAIADKFSKYSQYKTYKIDVGLKRTPSTYPIKEHKKIEDYEEKCPAFTKFFKDVSGDILFVVGGAGRISSASLTVLKRLKHCNINILYIKPDETFLGKESQILNNMVFGVFQEYARSGIFKRLYLVDNNLIENMLPEVSIKNYYDNLNEAIVSTLHMINLFNHTKSVTDTFSELPPATRISTIGIVDPENNKDQMFFSLDNATDIVYYYAYNKERLEEGGKLFSEIKNSIKEKFTDDVRITYGIFETSYKQDYIYCIKHTCVIQQ
jgi:hypothetical protein|tara:strand:- start:219 stop:1049 length:831 start_codon:yes stop_codon:yes gene_type:complete